MGNPGGWGSLELACVREDGSSELPFFVFFFFLHCLLKLLLLPETVDRGNISLSLTPALQFLSSSMSARFLAPHLKASNGSTHLNKFSLYLYHT